MEKTQLNSLVMSYKRDSNAETFRQLYEVATNLWRPKAYVIAKSIRADLHEVIALYDDVLMRCIERYDGATDFASYFLFCAKNARADLYRRKHSIAEHEALEVDSDAATFEVVDEEGSAEDAVLRTRKTDQRQLIGFLVADSDSATKAIVAECLRYHPQASVGRPKSLAGHVSDVLGIDKRTIKRKIETLASNFDSNQFGSHRDFLLIG